MFVSNRIISLIEFDKVMEGEIFYTTTLRNPPDHLRSVFSYFNIATRLGRVKFSRLPQVEFLSLVFVSLKITSKM